MMKCPKQQAFMDQLDLLIATAIVTFKDHFDVDTQDNYISVYQREYKNFVNLWCPTTKDYDANN